MVRCKTSTVVMYVNIGLSNCQLFVKTHYYSNKQHGSVDHNILVMKTELFAINIYKGDINLDIAQKT